MCYSYQQAKCAPQTRLGGFTLIELMIALAIACVLLVSALPSLRNLYRDHTLTLQANELINHINFARSTSVLRNIPITLCRTTSETATSCATGSAAWNFWMIRTNSNSVLYRGRLSPNKSLSQTLNSTSNVIVFGADGLARINGALASSGKYFQIIGTNDSEGNSRCLKFGAGTRLQVVKKTGACNG